MSCRMCFPMQTCWNKTTSIKYPGMGISNIYRLGVAKTEKFCKDTQTCIFQRGSISFPNHFFGGSKRCISGSMNLFLWREPISIQPSQSTTLQCFGRAQCMGEFPIIFVSPLGWWNKIPGSLEVKIFMTVEQPPHMYMGTFSTYVHLADACWSVWSSFTSSLFYSSFHNANASDMSFLSFCPKTKNHEP